MSKIGTSRKVSDPLSATWGKGNNPQWQTWLKTVADAINLPSSPAISTVTLSASPAVYQWAGAGMADLALDGANTAKVEFSRDGITYVTTGTGAGMYTLSQGDSLRITYTGAGPVVTLIPR